MESERFDRIARTWATASRRRVLAGLATALGGIVPLALGTTGADARKKKRCPPCKKRKKGKCKGTLPDGAPCAGGACRGGSCRQGCLPTDECCAADDCPPGVLCCNGECTDAKLEAGEACPSHQECCSNYCQLINPAETKCAPTCRGRLCAVDRECCRGFPCTEVGESGLPFCGGCIDGGGGCEAEADCCSSDCTALFGASGRQCASHPGGPCAKNLDCWTCALGGECTVTIDGATREVCHDGVCGCPDRYECCSNFDCDLDETCVFFVDAGKVNGECRPVLPG